MLAGIGDINGDGLDDIAVDSFSGTHVVFGSDAGFQSTLDLHALKVTDEAATNFLATGLDGLKLDVLIDNAGLMASRQAIDDMDFEECRYQTSFLSAV